MLEQAPGNRGRIGRRRRRQSVDGPDVSLAAAQVRQPSCGCAAVEAEGRPNTEERPPTPPTPPAARRTRQKGGRGVNGRRVVHCAHKVKLTPMFERPILRRYARASTRVLVLRNREESCKGRGALDGPRPAIADEARRGVAIVLLRGWHARERRPGAREEGVSQFSSRCCVHARRGAVRRAPFAPHARATTTAAAAAIASPRPLPWA